MTDFSFCRLLSVPTTNVDFYFYLILILINIINSKCMKFIFIEGKGFLIGFLEKLFEVHKSFNVYFCDALDIHIKEKNNSVFAAPISISKRCCWVSKYPVHTASLLTCWSYLHPVRARNIHVVAISTPCPRSFIDSAEFSGRVLNSNQIKVAFIDDFIESSQFMKQQTFLVERRLLPTSFHQPSAAHP